MLVQRVVLLHVTGATGIDDGRGIFLPVHDPLLERHHGLRTRNGCRRSAQRLNQLDVDRAFHGTDLQTGHVLRSDDRPNVVREGAEAVLRERQRLDPCLLLDVLKHPVPELPVHDGPGHGRRREQIRDRPYLDWCIEACEDAVGRESHFQGPLLDHLGRVPSVTELVTGEKLHLKVAIAFQLDVLLEANCCVVLRIVALIHLQRQLYGLRHCRTADQPGRQNGSTDELYKAPHATGTAMQHFMPPPFALDVGFTIWGLPRLSIIFSGSWCERAGQGGNLVASSRHGALLSIIVALSDMLKSDAACIAGPAELESSRARNRCTGHRQKADSVQLAAIEEEAILLEKPKARATCGRKPN